VLFRAAPDLCVGGIGEVISPIYKLHEPKTRRFRKRFTQGPDFVKSCGTAVCDLANHAAGERLTARQVSIQWGWCQAATLWAEFRSALFLLRAALPY
jgi:hypothetical protein